MEIRKVKIEDFKFLRNHDKHIHADMLKRKIADGTILVAIVNDEIIAWLRYNFFWDEHPFMNMLFVLEGHRGKGVGGELVSFWEEQMKKEGYEFCMVSTMANETSQVFYRKNGYGDIGGFVLDGEPMELIMRKIL